MKRTLLSAALVAAVLSASCTESQPTSPASGSLDVQVVVVEAYSGGQRASAINPDSSRVVLTGPENRTIRATPGSPVSFGELTAGTYAVALEVFEGGDLVVSGTLTGIQVVAGEATNVSESQLLIARSGVRFVALGERLELRAPNGTSWTTSDASIATVDASGVITAVGNGRVAIRGQLDNASVLINALIQQEVGSVTLNPAAATIDAGETIQFTAMAFDTAGAPLNDVNFLWIASDHNVATVDQNGLATATGGGSVTIAATGRGEPGTAALAVNPANEALAFRTQPPVLADLAFNLSPDVQVEVLDAAGDLVTASSRAITLSLPANAAGLQLGGTTTVSAVNGVATFTDLSLSLAPRPAAVQPQLSAEQYSLVASGGGLAPAVSGSFDVVEAPRVGGDVAIYRDYVAWSGYVEAAMQVAPLSLVLDTDYFVRPVADLQTGIPAETSVIIVTSASNADTPVLAMNDPAAVANLSDWVRNGGWLTVHAGDNVTGNGYTVPGLLGPADDVSECTGQNLLVPTHPIARGPDKSDPSDDLNDDNVDFSFYAGSCSDNHGSLDGVVPAGATVVMSAGTSRLPTYITYRYGNGRVTVTTLTIECCQVGDRAPLILSHAWWAIYGNRPTPLAPGAVPLAAPSLIAFPAGQSSTVPWSGGPGN